MFTGMELMACQDLAVSAELMRHVVHVESNANPYAIGVVGERLLRQPRNLGEALATVRMLDAGHYDYSLGLAQVHRANLRAYGLDYRKAFMPCPNVAAGARILADCHARSGGDWDKAFSCYYSGNFVTGYRDGYVGRIHDSISHDSINHDPISHHPVAHDPIGRDSISQQSISYESTNSASIGHGSTDHDRVGNDAQSAAIADSRTPARRVPSRPSHPDRVATGPANLGSPAHRVTIRNVAPDMAEVSPLAAAARPAPRSTEPSAPVKESNIPSLGGRVPDTTITDSGQPATTVFVPQVRGPGDPIPMTTSAAPTPAISMPGSNARDTDHANLHGVHGDAAFVF